MSPRPPRRSRSISKTRNVAQAWTGRVRVAELPLVGGKLAVRVHVPFAREEQELALGEAGVEDARAAGSGRRGPRPRTRDIPRCPASTVHRSRRGAATCRCGRAVARAVASVAMDRPRARGGRHSGRAASTRSGRPRPAGRRAARPDPRSRPGARRRMRRPPRSADAATHPSHRRSVASGLPTAEAGSSLSRRRPGASGNAVRPSSPPAARPPCRRPRRCRRGGRP